MNKVQLISAGIGFVAGAVFKLFELLAGSSSKDVIKDPREWIVSVIFACIAAGASYVLARWQPSDFAKVPPPPPAEPQAFTSSTRPTIRR